MVESPLLLRVLFSPGEVFRDIASRDNPQPPVLSPLLALLLLLPPLCAAVGGSLFGWRLGTPQPLELDLEQTLLISVLYALLLSFGFFSTVLLARWMGSTYGAEAGMGDYVGLFVVVAAPISLASLAHLFPHVFLNIVVLLPAVIWSMLLLYRGLPVVLRIPGERGMLMASAIVGWLLVAMVSLLGLSAGLWTVGLGPTISI